MRGLEIRIALANARIFNAIYIAAGGVGEIPESVNLTDFLYDALDLGYADAEAGESVAPAMFVDEPLLLGAWEDGQNMHDFNCNGGAGRERCDRCDANEPCIDHE